MSGVRRREVLESADLLINVSGTLKRPVDYRGIARLAYIDSDPVFTQIKLALPRGHLKFQRRVATHDVHFSFGERLSSAMPPTPYTWLPTRQPIVLDQWQTNRQPGRAYTAVMSWASYKPLRYRGRLFGQKDMEFRRFMALPQLRPDDAFELALNTIALDTDQHLGWESSDSHLAEAQEGARVSPLVRLTQAGWKVVDAGEVCSDVDRYRSYIQGSRGEWSVSKNGYVQGSPGWFSCRSACYLAAGRPVMVEDTGFGAVIPTGRGLLSFSTLDEAADALGEVEANYSSHARAARELAQEFFDSGRVLTSLVERAM